MEPLGKGIVMGKDTPNFVGNRIGAHAMMTAIHLMLEDGLTPEDVDAITTHLASCGVEIEVGPVQRAGARGTMTSVYCRDPDGSLIEISTYR